MVEVEKIKKILEGLEKRYHIIRRKFENKSTNEDDINKGAKLEQEIEDLNNALVQIESGKRLTIYHTEILKKYGIEDDR